MKKAAVLTAALLLVCAVLGAQERVRDQKDKTQYETVFDLLRGEPGVTVGPGGGNGEMPSIIIRGIATNSSYTQPLFVVDGIITDNVTYLRPEDIYSVEVLKDGTASIYGVQGQNGVIMFRTKAAVEAENWPPNRPVRRSRPPVPPAAPPASRSRQAPARGALFVSGRTAAPINEKTAAVQSAGGYMECFECLGVAGVGHDPTTSGL